MTQTAKETYIKQTKENRKRIELSKAIVRLAQFSQDKRIR